MNRQMLCRCSTLSNLFWILVVVQICLASYSYAGFDATSPEDYIGPVKGEPNALTARQESNNMAISSVVQQPDQNNTLDITVTQAVLLALENNKSLVVQRFIPQIRRTFEQEELSVFDPVITARISDSQTKSQTVPQPGSPSLSSLDKELSADVGISQFFPTGTTLSLDGSTDDLTRSILSQPFDTTRFGVSATQSLLRGFGAAVNLASVNQARIDTKASQYELRGFVENLVASIEETYWDYALAQRQIDIVNQSLEIAQKQLEETKERIAVGSLAKSELTTAEAETALRQENLIDAKSTLAKTKLNFLRLVNPPGSNLWNRDVVLQSVPANPAEQAGDVEMHVALAQQLRPELNQAKLQWQRDEMEIVKTKNGLLPKLDLFVTLGKTGYADSFGKSSENIGSKNDYDLLGGIVFEYPPLNRGADARNIRAIVTRDQAREAINNLSQLVEVDVRNAYLEITRARELVAATAASRKLQEEKLRIETEKFRVGKSTLLLVAQAQRDFLASQIAEIQAVMNHIKAFVEFYRLDGSLLERRGIASPGRQTVKLSDITVH